jgi:tetratricopeptide (TPR) repeat protein
MLKTIREVDPPKPSTRISQSANDLASISAKRHTEPRRLQKLIAGDLDWIVMKCLEKDRTRRYETANGLAMDIERHLHDEAVMACPPGQLYKLQKLVRRNKLACTATACVMLALVVGLAASLWQAGRANHEAARAQNEAARAAREADRARLAEHQAIATLDELRATAPTFFADAKTLAAKGQFDLAIEKLNYAVKLQPNAPELLVTKGDFYLCQLKIPEAAADYRNALRVKPSFAPAEMKATLCDQLLAAPPPVLDKLSLESLVKIYSALEPEKRSAAELKDIKGAYADEKERLWKYWLPRLQSLPMFAHIPPGAFAWERHFDIRDDGQLSLYLGDIDFSDLSQLKDLPIADLHISRCRDVTDVQALADMPSLENVTVPVLARNIEALHKLPKLKRLSFSAFVTQVGPTVDVPTVPVAQQQKLWSSNSLDQAATLRRQFFFDINGRVARPTPETTAEEFWKLYSTLSWLSRLRDSAIKPNEISRLADGTWYLNFDHKKEFNDLELLRGTPISELYCGGTSVSDLSPLRGMPLKILVMWGTRVTDLTPIKGMPITLLDCSWTHAIDDLSPLKGMPLVFLSVDSTAVSDLTPLRGMPLTVLRLNSCANLTDLSPLADAKRLRQLTLPPKFTDFEFLHTFPKLERLSFDEDVDRLIPDKTADQFWAGIKEEPWVNALRITGLKPKESKKLDDGTWELDLGNSAIRDLTPLKRAPISRLSLGHTAVTDLAPLRGMKLKRLALNETEVTDLEPLRGMLIEELFLSNTKVVDLSPLRGMPLRTLNLRSCTKITDISTLADCRSLRALILPPHAKDIKFLRSFPQLEQLSYKGVFAGGAGFQTPKDFWAEYDHNHPSVAP